MHRILTVFGTRPEAIKMAPVIKELERRPGVVHAACSTGQHRDLLDQVLKIFHIEPAYDLCIMKAGQSLTDVTTGVLQGLEAVFRDFKPTHVLVQGDTTTAFAAALAAFYANIPVSHVEAGLRTGNLYSPWPEEANRRLVSIVAHRHFAPTEQAKQSLLREGVNPAAVLVTGNTVIDALLHTRATVLSDPALLTHTGARLPYTKPDKPLLLVTLHRRENHGERLRGICTVIARLAQTQNLRVLFPVHPNPNVRSVTDAMLNGIPNVDLVEPLDYPTFIRAMDMAWAILTDSGGVQEEAPSLGKPVLVARDTTERPEGVAAGTSILCGTGVDMIEQEILRLIRDPAAYAEMTGRVNPYGDGQAAIRIADALLTDGAPAP